MPGEGIVGRADSLRLEIEQLPAQRQGDVDAQAVTTRANQLNELAFDLANQVSRLRLFRERGLHPKMRPEQPAMLLDMTRSHRAKFEEDRTSIAADPEDSDFKWKYRDELLRLSRSIDHALDEAWRDYIDKLIPPGLDQQLELLGSAGALADQIVRMRELGDVLKEARSQTARDVSAFERVKGSAVALSGLWGTLSEIPADVRAFMAAASTDGAPVDALTPEVRTWLEEKGFLDSVRLVMKGGA